MTASRDLRVADGLIVRPVDGIDLDPLTGEYTCAAGTAGGLSRLRTEPRDGTLWVRAAGHGAPQSRDLGELAVDAVFADAPRSRVGYAFLATFDDGQVCSHLQTYQGLGVVVVHTFTSFRDERWDYFTREFFVPANRAAQGGPTLPAAATGLGPCDPAELLGSWTNVNPAATGLAEMECLLSGSQVMLRTRAVGDLAGWGEALPRLYADAGNPEGPPALLATYDHGYMRVHLQARINRGLLVVAEYTEFTDGSGRSDFMMRECFCR